MEVSQSHAPAVLTQGAAPATHCGPQSRSARYGSEENPLPLTGIEPRLLGRVIYTEINISQPVGLNQLGETSCFENNNYFSQRTTFLHCKHKLLINAAMQSHF
jgi:hypothetical protein